MRSRAANAVAILLAGCFSAASAPAIAAAVASGADLPAFVAPSAALTLQEPPESIYAPPEPPREDQGVNGGAVHIDMTARYMTDYVYRGIDYSEVGGAEDSPNYQIDAKLYIDLGKLPHPYVGVFSNYYDSDPVSHLQEIRPNFGFDWPIKPMVFSAGYNCYIYPDRDQLGTSEAYGKIALDDSFLFGTETPILSPYVYGAYDFDKYNGWYFEAGVKHDFAIRDTGLTLTLLADVAYVTTNQQYLASGTDDTGFQHYDLGAIGTYSLNALFNIPKRYGEISFQAYLYYTDNIDENLLAATELWGGAGINFKY